MKTFTDYLEAVHQAPTERIDKWFCIVNFGIIGLSKKNNQEDVQRINRDIKKAIESTGVTLENTQWQSSVKNYASIKYTFKSQKSKLETIREKIYNVLQSELDYDYPGLKPYIRFRNFYNPDYNDF